MNKKKILFLSVGNSYFGAEKSLKAFIDEIDKDRFLPIVLVPTKCSYIDAFVGNKVEVYKFDFQYLFGSLSIKKIIGSIIANFKLLNFQRNQKIDIVHLNLTPHIERLFIFFMFLCKPYFIHFRMHYSIDFFEKVILSKSFRIISVSEAVKKELLKKRRSDFIIKISPDKVVTIYDADDLSKYVSAEHLEQLKSEFNIRTDKKIVALIGAIDSRKRQDLFLLAAREIKNCIPNAIFMIIGDVYGTDKVMLEYKQLLYELVKTLRLSTDVVFTGYRHDVERLIQIVDVLVVPSQREALGTVAVQAMAAGKPVVASAVDGLSEVVKDGETGYLISSDNSKDYASKIIELLKNEQNRIDMGEKGRQRALKLFDIKKNSRIIERLYTESLNINAML